MVRLVSSENYKRLEHGGIKLRKGFRPGQTNHLSPLLESLLLQVRGSSGSRLNAKDLLPPIASREEVEATKNHVLETFYPISPTVDLQECNVYDVKDDTGEYQAFDFQAAWRREMCFFFFDGKGYIQYLLYAWHLTCIFF